MPVICVEGTEGFSACRYPLLKMLHRNRKQLDSKLHLSGRPRRRAWSNRKEEEEEKKLTSWNDAAARKHKTESKRKRLPLAAVINMYAWFYFLDCLSHALASVSFHSETLFPAWLLCFPPLVSSGSYLFIVVTPFSLFPLKLCLVLSNVLSLPFTFPPLY